MYSEKLQLLINGRWIGEEGGRKGEDVFNPADEQVLARLPHATRDDLDAALDAAQKAFRSWKKSSPMERSKIMRRAGDLIRERADEIARNMTLDQGKPFVEARGEIMACADLLDWHAEEGRRIYGRVIPARAENVRQLVVREPIGVCVAFTPWNFPANQAIRKIAAAIGSGCTLILKGPEETPSAVVALARAMQDAGLPDGCLNLVWGVPAEISSYLIASPITAKVSFTGSVPVGKQLASLASLHMKRSTMELGGHAPVLIFPDADVERAADIMAGSKIRNAGQVCVSPTRFYVHEKVQDQFLERFSANIAKVKVGNGLDADSQMGPLVNARRVEAIDGFVQEARGNGSTIMCGGERIGNRGHFYAPTVVFNPPEDSRLMTEEPFGPIAAVTSFKDTDDVLRRANSLPFGLASYVFTQSSKTVTQVSDGLESGMVTINHLGLALPETPFGGIKDSGYGSEGGTEAFDGYLITKFITQFE
ncbi:succinate-semialdehyde dehydrogenase/glutarate-semialdehyde dehydrogenase [Paenochrobactrum gallinarii]|uniref:Succinate-semialdehyde dehydrogenase/glutarate-semialdehyde dehydrogenase n=1 Tax=Paenochrobactrum gallinarii TaxID=643673 RepID=A0A841LY55_9HYPH|nr:NAD-dependent succinate-semialdehyde dehydrogenase [Paenochrobactrum gallinarii]MBB6262306.1 succinate-semialdehyde dehydrogenase/glutarate-semialdehyde dehydrogenase [Paenochrobactrum gallinarii]